MKGDEGFNAQTGTVREPGRPRRDRSDQGRPLGAPERRVGRRLAADDGGGHLADPDADGPGSQRRPVSGVSVVIALKRWWTRRSTAPSSPVEAPLVGKLTMDQGPEHLKAKINSLISQGRTQIMLNLGLVHVLTALASASWWPGPGRVMKTGGALKLLNVSCAES